MAENKKNRVSIVDIDGTKYRFKFHAITGLEPVDLICEKHCPLDGICDKLRDPRNMSDEEGSFMDFCLAAGQKGKSDDEIMNDETITNLAPDMGDVIKWVEGVDSDIYQALIKDNPLVNLNQVIDNVCGPNGYACGFYNEEHSNCTSKNGLCILKSLFKA